MRTSRDVRGGRSSRPQHHRVLYFPHRRLWIMECSFKVWCMPCRRRPTPRLHSRLSWRLRTRLVAFDHRTLDEALSAACRQEGEMQQYLEEKKASQTRPVDTFQWQDKKKAVYQAQQRSVAVGSTQALIRLLKTSPGDLHRLEDSWDIREGFPDVGLASTSTKNPEQEDFGGFLGLPKESFINVFDPFEDLLRGK
ncbi:hypothetical protein Taro_056102 [Colocasia esculenta]|uniref:Uncharacterized protein n=1 Tax=Colocasia esculenta TaxID=4460 RepID=A0A843XVH9_COLES|nr:hypothetical protein [Colocasia esculenta]